MFGLKLAIFVITILVTMLLGRMGGVREWWRALQDRPTPSLVLIAAVTSTFIGGTGFDTSSMIPDASRLARGLVLITILAVSIGGILQSPYCWRNAGTGTRWMLAYALLAISSAAYSIGPLISAYKGFEVLVLVTAGIYLAGQLRRKEDLRWVLDVFSIILLFLAVSVLVGVVLAPQEAFRAGTAGEASAITRTVRGLLGAGINPSSVGGFGAFLLVSALVPIFDNSRRSGKTSLWIVVVISTAVMLLAHSRTAIFGATAAVMMILIFKRKAMLAVSIATLGALIILVTTFGDLIMAYIYRGQSQELFLSMSGRTYHWGLIFEEYLKSPIIGHGFYAGIRVLFGTSSADNTYLETLLGLGIVGVLFLFMPVLYLVLTLFRTRPRRSNPWPGDVFWLQISGLAAIIILRSALGASFQVLHHLLAFFLVIQIATAAYRRIWREHRLYLPQDADDARESPVTGRRPVKDHIPARRKIPVK